MKRVTVLASCLLLFLGLAGAAEAATSGSYRCVALQGTLEEVTATIPIVMHYNPNSTPQSIRQIQIRDGIGVLIYDSGLIPAGNPAYLVPGYGSWPVFTVATPYTEGLQITVRWSQTSDKKAPIPRLNLFHFDGVTETFTSSSQSTCP